MSDTNSLSKLAAPAQRALASAGIATLEQLARLTEDEILKLHGVGKNAVAALRKALAAKGLAFRKAKKPL